MTEGMTSKALALHMTLEDVVSLLERHEELKRYVALLEKEFHDWSHRNWSQVVRDNHLAKLKKEAGNAKV